MRGYVTVHTEVDVDVDEVIDELSEKDLREALDRKLGVKRPDGGQAAQIDPDWDRLAEMIAEGDRTGALDLLYHLRPTVSRPLHVLRRVADRHRH